MNSSAASPDQDPQQGGQVTGFRTTQWGVVDRAGGQDPEALENLCRIYWPAIYSYARRVGHLEEEAKDLTQGFFVALLDGNQISRADRKRGRFRSFLLTLFKRFVANEYRAKKAWKRGGRVAFISWDEVEGFEERRPEGDADLPERRYDRIWAHALLESVMIGLRAEYEQSGKAEVFRVLSPRLSAQSDGTPTYAEIAKSLQLTESGVKMAMNRMRQRFGTRLREAVAATVGQPREIDDEIRYLLAVLAD